MALSKVAKGVKPRVSAISVYVVEKFPKIPNVWGYANSPDHNTKECVDYMVANDKISPADSKALGTAIANLHIALHKAGNIKIVFMVWRGRAWRPEKNDFGPEGWGDYYAPNTHFDHVHVQYDPDVWKRPAVPAKPVKKSGTWVVIKPVQGYYGPSKPGKNKGSKYLRPVGFKVTGTIVTLKDGKYIKTKWNTYYPFQSGNFKV